MTPPAPPAPRAADDADALDLAWLHATANRDRTAFERLYRRHHPRLARFLRRFTARADLIDDVVNDTMWVVWRGAADFRGGSKVSTWITGIAYRCMLKALRGTAPQEEVSEGSVDPVTLDAALAVAALSADPDVERERSNWVARGLLTLPDDQRVTIELAYFLGQSCEEIAAVMGCAVGTVKARMFHARVRLRNVLPAIGGLLPPMTNERTR